MTAHVENVKVYGKRLGLRAPQPRRALPLGRLLTGTMPEHPVSVMHTNAFSGWQMLGNDEYSDCGPVGVANLRALTTAALTGTPLYPDLDAVLDLYMRSGNPGFPKQDDGVEMQEMLEALLSGGIMQPNNTIVKPLAFAKVDVENIDECRAAIAIFGALLLGVDLQISQQAQTDTGSDWDYVEGSGEWGSHAVMVADYYPNGLISWARRIGMTDTFWDKRVQEAWVVIWPENLGMKQFQEGINYAQLVTDFRTLTGRSLPGSDPVPEPPMDSLVHEAKEILAGLKRQAAQIEKWLQKHGM